MKTIILEIPEEKYEFFIELFEQLGVEVTDEMEIPEEHKEIVRERIKNSNPDDLIPWKEARKQLRFNRP
ncbi:MAG: hypothetical protein K9I94_08285 [Bacteroidales bacterium]|nr:hypothetical protein [Bacteroidales bacterium]